MTRGFITIATGNKHYYKLASNLLQSYRYFSIHAYPFAIIAEEENQYTDQFDDVILTDESTHSFMDKFLLLKLCPYDENIFIDADCLAYGDLNKYWDLFESATDFSAFGVNIPRDQEDGAWYNIEDIGVYGQRIDYKVRVHSGVCFIRKGDNLKALYQDSLDIANHYEELYFHTCPQSKDECILDVAMPLNGMKAVKAGDLLATYPLASNLKADIIHGKLQYETQWQGFVENGLLLHWGTAQTITPLYQFESSCLNYLTKRKRSVPSLVSKVWYEKRLFYYVLLVQEFFQKIQNYTKRILKLN